MSMTCSRAANERIEWDAIAFERPDGLKQLCQYDRKVDLG